ncbi:MAG: cytochrome c oxidase subunit 3 [Bacteroidota bacterium]
MEEQDYVIADKKRKEKASQNLLWLGIVSIVMLFGSLCSGFLVSKGMKFWVNLSVPPAFWISTGIIIVSSVTVNMALSAIKKDNKSLAKYMLLVTFLLGIGFSVTQFNGWKQLKESGSYFANSPLLDDNGNLFIKGEYGTDFTYSFAGQELDFKDGKFYLPDGKELNPAQVDQMKDAKNTAASYMYLLTALHVLHLLGGLIYMIIVMLKAFLNHFNSQNHLKIKLISIYWHFLDALWILLFLFLQFIH